MHELVARQRGRRHGGAARGRPAGDARSDLRVGRLRQVVPDSLEFYFGIVARDGRLRGRAAGARGRAGASCAARTAATRGSSRRRRSAARRAAAATSRSSAARSSWSSRSRSRRTHASHVREGARGRRSTPTGRSRAANRADFDRAGVTVVNLMSAPGAGKTTLLEGVAAAARGRARRACSRATCRRRSTPTGIARLHVPVTQINTDPSFGGECHLDANMVRSALPSLPLDELDLLVVENVGNLVCPAEFRVGEDRRVMVSSVTEGEDKPLKYPLMFRACDARRRQQDRPAAAPRLRPRPLPRATSTRSTPASSSMLVSARTGEGVEQWRDWLRRSRPGERVAA